MRLKFFALLFLSCIATRAQAQQQNPTMSGRDMPSMTGSSQDTHNMATSSEGSAMRAMEGHLGMGPHMKLTELRPLKPGDKEEADEVVCAARAVAEKYADYKIALADGYKIFLPNLPQKQYHFTNYRYAWQARNHFDPSHPTSLLYEKHGDDYRLIGVMYTERKDASDDELNSRIPLSIAQWHAHVKLCMPARNRRAEALPSNAQFGLAGSISTKEACDAAGGRFFPQVFGWMVHVYPLEQKPEDIWSVERQANNHMD
jgi:hypothetical protein